MRLKGQFESNMARTEQPTDEQLASWGDWLAERPEHVRRVAERFEPWTLFRMKSTGHRCHVFGFDETKDGDVTLRVQITGKYNLIDFERNVFGIEAADLEECALPSPDENLGALLTDPAHVKAYIEMRRDQGVFEKRGAGRC